MLAGACSAEESSTPTVELSTTSTPITTEPTTTEPPTTEAPTTTEDPRIAEVEAAVVAARQTQVALLKDPSRSVDQLEAMVGGEALDAVVPAILMVRADGLSVRGEFVSRSISTDLLQDDVAIHLECGLDGVGAYDGDEVVVAPDTTGLVREYRVERAASGSWLVTSIVFPGSERTPCDV